MFNPEQLRFVRTYGFPPYSAFLIAPKQDQVEMLWELKGEKFPKNRKAAKFEYRFLENYKTSRATPADYYIKPPNVSLDVFKNQHLTMLMENAIVKSQKEAEENQKNFFKFWLLTLQ